MACFLSYVAKSKLQIKSILGHLDVCHRIKKANMPFRRTVRIKERERKQTFNCSGWNHCNVYFQLHIMKYLMFVCAVTNGHKLIGCLPNPGIYIFYIDWSVKGQIAALVILNQIITLGFGSKSSVTHK